jgi:hypothetical protein
MTQPQGYPYSMSIEDENKKENRGYEEDGGTLEEEAGGDQDAESQGKAESHPHQPSDGRGHTRAGSNVPNAGKDPSQDRRE